MTGILKTFPNKITFLSIGPASSCLMPRSFCAWGEPVLLQKHEPPGLATADTLQHSQAEVPSAQHL